MVFLGRFAEWPSYTTAVVNPLSTPVRTSSWKYSGFSIDSTRRIHDQQVVDRIITRTRNWLLLCIAITKKKSENPASMITIVVVMMITIEKVG